MRPRASTGWLTNELAPSTFRHFVETRGTIQLLRLVGVCVVFWYERIVFLYASLQCSPWDASAAIDVPQNAQTPSDTMPSANLVITILADPQLIDANSYSYMQHLPWPLSSTVYYIARWAADTYVRKSYQAAVRVGGRAGSDAVVWLGDLLDRGRVALASAADVERYERATHRFHGLFRERLPTLFLPGNHDVRIPLTHDPVLIQESHDSRERWIQEWGTWHDARQRATWSVNGGREHVLVRPKGGPAIVKVLDGQSYPRKTSEAFLGEGRSQRVVNARIPIYLNTSSSRPTHELVLVDALDLAGMLPAGSAAEADWQLEGRREFPQTYDFVESIGRDAEAQAGSSGVQDGNPVRILFTHIPLYRPPGTLCNRKGAKHGILRESTGDIEQGVDQYASYQNTLAQPVTEWLLDHTSPLLAFSGDNHDHCEVKHFGSQTRPDSTELTLKAFGMTGGVRRPGYARVGLYLDPSSHKAHATAVPCVLPDQIAIWTFAYPVALIFIATILALDRRYRVLSRLDRKYRDTMAAWRLNIASRVSDGAVVETQSHTPDDEDWQMIERGERIDVHAARLESDVDSDADERGGQAHAIRTLPLPGSNAASPSGSKRIRYGRSSGAPSLLTPKRGGLPAVARSASSFEARAVRELKLAAAMGEAVLLRSGFLTEFSQVLSGPLLLWLWFQLF